MLSTITTSAKLYNLGSLNRLAETAFLNRYEKQQQKKNDEATKICAAKNKTRHHP
ncbi:MAG: hypothetical protein IPG98_00020 [Burkholderiales bacterium]|nr:hypothetical protein [Burkholderiales bacterium]